MRRLPLLLVGAGAVAAAAAAPALPRVDGLVTTTPRLQLVADTGRTVSPDSAQPVRTLVALGDSVTAGDQQGGDAFPEQVGRRLSLRGSPVHVTNLGAGGLTATQLRARVRSDETTRSALSDADVVLVTIGANDVAGDFTESSDTDCDAACVQRAADAVRGDVTALLRDVRATDSRTQPRVLVTTYWNVGLDGAVARAQESARYHAWTDQVTRAVNDGLCQAAKDSGSTCVDLYAPFKGDGSGDPTSLLADDGDHPDEQGQRLIADTLVDALAR